MGAPFTDFVFEQKSVGGGVFYRRSVAAVKIIVRFQIFIVTLFGLSFFSFFAYNPIILMG